MLVASLAVLVVGYAWVTAGLRPFTFPSLVVTLAGGVAAIMFGARLPPRPAPERAMPGSVWAWLALGAAVAVWELQSFLQHPRSQHPTLSYLTNIVLDARGSRMVAIVGWLAGGVWLTRR